MKVAIIGSRDFNDYELMTQTLDNLEISLIISGGAKGADALAERYALMHNIGILIFKPEYKLYNRGAPLKRNYQIIDASDYVVAFWNGKSRGTKHAIDYALSQNKQVINPIYKRDVLHSIILHIPHSSTLIPECYSTGWIGDPDEAIRILTDHYTDELFDYPAAHRVIATISRIVCDVERFETGEEMEDHFGMGIVYERDHLQNILHVVTPDLKKEIVEHYYRPHHRALYNAVTEELSKNGSAVIVDCHSFNDEQLPHVTNSVRPDFCIGADSFHTPPELVDQLVKYLNDCGYCVTVNEPFAGTIVPLDYYHVNPAVMSVMIEVNKRLYLDDQIQKSREFETIKAVITELLKIISNFKT